MHRPVLSLFVNVFTYCFLSLLMYSCTFLLKTSDRLTESHAQSPDLTCRFPIPVKPLGRTGIRSYWIRASIEEVAANIYFVLTTCQVWAMCFTVLTLFPIISEAGPILTHILPEKKTDVMLPTGGGATFEIRARRHNALKTSSPGLSFPKKRHSYFWIKPFTPFTLSLAARTLEMMHKGARCLFQLCQHWAERGANRLLPPRPALLFSSEDHHPTLCWEAHTASCATALRSHLLATNIRHVVLFPGLPHPPAHLSTYGWRSVAYGFKLWYHMEPGSNLGSSTSAAS